MNTNSSPPFKVGQVVYLIPTGERRVIPAQITEEILRRTLSGEETVWMIKLAGSQKSVPLDPDAAEYYTDVEALRDILIQRTTQQVNGMLLKTVELAEEAFGRPERPAETFSVPSDLVDDSVATVIMPDGAKAKVRIK